MFSPMMRISFCPLSSVSAFAGAMAFSLLLTLAAPAMAQTIETPARHAFLIDITNGTVLLNKDADVRMPTSSMSKIMTAYMVFDALKVGKIKLEDEFTVSERAWKMEGSRSFMDVESKVKVEDLVRGVIIQSGNDAAVILAEGVAGSEETFVELMNAKAKELGLHETHFVNATGLPDPNHYSTARDLATLAVRVMNDFPDYYHYFGEKEFLFNNIKQGNRNPLLYKDIGVDGLKTGHAEEAGYGLTASAVRDGRRLVLVVNGLKNLQERADESTRLINWGYAEFPLHVIHKRGEVIGKAKVAFGKEKMIAVAVPEDVSATVHQTKIKDLKTVVDIKQPLMAPVARGTKIGTLVVMLDETVIQQIPLVADENMERLPFFAYWWAKIMYLITGKAE